MPPLLRIALLVFIALGVLGFVAFLFIRAFRRSDDPARLLVKWVVTAICAGVIGWLASGSGPFGAVYAVLISVPFAIALAFMWGPHIGRVLASPITAAMDGGGEELEPAPLYSIAEALRRRGKFREAVYAIQEQLQKFPGDFTGQMMVAEIQAENLNDLQAAETGIRRICEQKNHAPPSLAYALNSLADWHLKFAQDAEAARVALEKIIALLPGTEFERSAANRIAHLGDRSVLLQSHEPDTIPLKPGVEYLGLLKDQSHLLPVEKSFEEEAAQLISHLESHPLDHEARERLAVIYARHYGRLDLAAEQLEQLIALPGESPKHVAQWLHVLASLQIEGTGRTDLAEQTLRRIIDLFPKQALAELAEQRIGSLGLELKQYEPGRTVKFTPTPIPEPGRERKIR